MPLTGGFFQLAGSAVALADFVPAGSFKQIDFFAAEGNVGTIYVGPASVQSSGTDAYQAIGAGESWGHDVKGAGEQMQFEFSEVYINGTSGDKFHVSIVK